MLNSDRKDELVVIRRDFIERKVGKIDGDAYIGVSLQDGSPVFVQFDDLNKDGIWDELAFLYNFKAKERVKLYVSTERVAMLKPVVRAYVRQMRKHESNSFGSNLLKDSVPAGRQNNDFTKVKLPGILTEGPAWENDKVGFRIYRCTKHKDIWGKTTGKMMMDEVG